MAKGKGAHITCGTNFYAGLWGKALLTHQHQFLVQNFVANSSAFRFIQNAP